MVGFAVGGGGCCGKTDLVGDEGKCCKQRQRFETGDRGRMGIDATGQSIRQKHHVELRLFGGLCDAAKQVEILASRFRLRVPPAGDVMACALEKQAEVDLSLGSHGIRLSSEGGLVEQGQKAGEIGLAFHAANEFGNIGESRAP